MSSVSRVVPGYPRAFTILNAPLNVSDGERLVKIASRGVVYTPGTRAFRATRNSALYW